MKLWTYNWFILFIAWCRKWSWFDTYIYGKSLNLEDFVRNPAEVFRDVYPPFIIKDIKSYSIINWRLFYIPFNPNVNVPNCWEVPMGKHKLVCKIGNWVISDLRLFNPFWTKFCNCGFFFQLALSFKYYIIPIPYISLCIRFSKYKYFQFGIGWGAESHLVANRVDAVLCGKFRYINQKTSNEVDWNPSDVIDYYEGTN
jgi:hypothetical protein